MHWDSLGEGTEVGIMLDALRDDTGMLQEKTLGCFRGGWSGALRNGSRMLAVGMLGCFVGWRWDAQWEDASMP